jgi:hypothetical protein
MSRWHRLQRPRPGEQTNKVEVVAPAPDMTGIAQQLKHAREQQALASWYPGRERSMPSDAKAIELDTGKPKA